jgi:hypothetical protein
MVEGLRQLAPMSQHNAPQRLERRLPRAGGDQALGVGERVEGLGGPGERVEGAGLVVVGIQQRLAGPGVLGGLPPEVLQARY